MARKEDVLNDLPQKLVAKLLPFQIDGIYDAICKQGRCLIADEMGLGKTLQAITVAYYYRSEWPALIIVPSTLKYTWIEELEKWLPELQPKEINLIQAGNDVSGLNLTKITLVSYGILNKKTSNLVLEALINQKFKVVIADESHYIKNIKSVSSKVIVPIIKAANRRILLSGTPALSRPVELFPQLEALNTNMFGTFWEFTNRYCGAKYEYFGKKRYRKVNGATNLDELQQKLLETVMIRREKKDVLTQLPPKQRQRILFELKDSSIKKEIFSLFQELKPKLRTMKDNCKQVGGLFETETESNLPFEILQSFQNLYKLSGEAKIGPVQDYIKMLCSNNDLKFLIFAYHHDMMDGISQALWDLKVKFIRIDGTTHPSDRQTFVNQFQSDSETCVAVLSILAAGVGLTFTAAKMVVFAEMYWTPGVMIQCEDRAHRIGQTSSLPIHYLVAKGSMDEWMWSILNRKTGVVSTILDGHRKKLDAEKGNQDQIDILSNADVWDPNKCSDPVDISLMLQPEDTSNQRSILQFFQPSESDKLPLNSHKKPISNVKEDSLEINSLKSTSNKEKRKSTSKSFNQQKRLNDSNDCSTFKESPCKKIKLSCSPVPDSFQNFSEESEFTKLASSKIEAKLDESNANDKHKVESKSLKLEFFKNSSNVKKSKSKSKRNHKFTEENKKDKTPTTKWNCPVCTFLNHKDLTVCEVCEIGKRHFDEEHQELPITKSENKNPSPTKCDQSFNAVSTPSRHTDLNDQEATPRSVKSKHKFTFRKTWNDNLKYSPILPTHRRLNSPDRTESSVNESNITENSLDINNCDISEDLSDNAEGFDSPSKAELSMKEQNMTENSLDIDNCDISEDLSDNAEGFDSPSKAELSMKEPNMTENSLDIDNCDISEDLSDNAEGFDSPSKAELSVNEPNMTENPLDINHCDFKEKTTDNADSHSKISFDEKDIRHFDQPMYPVVVESKDSSDIPDLSLNHVVNDNQSDNLEGAIKYDKLMFCCSQFTSRLHLYDQDKCPLNANFLPQDIEMNNFSELPDFMKHPHNLRLIHRFVRQWNNLTETKQRFISKHKMIFSNPIMAYEEIRCDKSFSVQRHLSKETVAQTSLINAQKTQGSIRLISNKKMADELSVDSLQQKDEKGKGFNITKGIVQALDSDGIPMCINCQKPFDNTLINEDTVKKAENAWNTRFCSYECMDMYLMKTKQGYCREKLFQIEHGICQLCGLDAESIFQNIKSQPDVKKRVKILQSSQFNQLTSKQKEAIIKNPSSGMFWQADHIKAVYKGGGQCDIDNFRTLCVLCHKKVTADQTKQRAIEKKESFAIGTRKITNFFKIS